jgi:hypothetical protein
MQGRLAGVGFPLLFGGYLLYSYLPESGLFAKGPRADHASVVAALGAFLVIIAVVFLIRNLK